jgi:hydrogenase/urease accessory protein HupE
MSIRSRVGDRRAALLGALFALAAAAGSASAHGIGAQDPNRPVAEYLWLGFKHLIVGWDHLLFILAIVLLADNLWRATKLISLFVLGHSVTLMLSTTQEWTVSTTFVDVVIALSIVFVAAVALFHGRPKDWRPFGAALLIIGLIHGLGLGTRLLELGVSDDNLFWRILLFNIGVELGQAVAVLAFGGLFIALTRYAPQIRRLLLEPAFVLIATAGLVGAIILAVNGSDEKDAAPTTIVENEASAEKEASASCEQAAAPPVPSNNAGHPEFKFYGPGDLLPRENFDHVVGDGYVVVTYDPDLPEDDIAALQEAVESEDKAMIAGADPAQSDALRAVTARRMLVCDAVDVEALVEFRDAWFTEVYG